MSSAHMLGPSTLLSFPTPSLSLSQLFPTPTREQATGDTRK
uniref:Uncharacterized protein n=1 Tax=Arundo donax TaxID=35708 RepID=A0A0A8YJQ5_ARUDO